MNSPDTLDCLTSAPISVGDPSCSLTDLDTIVALYQPRIFSFLLLSLRDPDTAFSITQDTFLKAWLARDSFRGDCSLYTWLMRIAVNLLRDHTRTERFRFWKKAANTSIDASSLAAHLPHRVSSAEARLIAREQLQLVWETVNQLSNRQRTIFLLRFLDNLELPQISIITGLPVSTVKSHLYRALAAVRNRHAASPISPQEQP